MKKSTTISLIIGAGIIVFLGLVAAVASGIYYFAMLGIGNNMAGQGYTAEVQGDHQAAIDRLTKALRSPLARRTRYYAHLNRGLAYGHENKPDQAIEDFTAAIDLDSTSADAFWDRAVAYAQKAEPEKALPDLNRALAHDPSLGPAHFSRGNILYNKGDIDGALADFEEAVRCLPNRADAFLMRAKCYLLKNDLDHALASFDTAITMNAIMASAYEGRAEVYRRKGLNERARLDLAEARALNPSTRPALLRPWALPNKSSAKMTLDVAPLPHIDLRSTHPTTKTFTELLVDVREASRTQDLERAQEICNQALALDATPADAARALLFRSEIHRQKNEIDQALQDSELAIRLNPKNSSAYVSRALALERKDEREDALRDYREALRLDPKSFYAYSNRAIFLRGDSQFDNALADLDKAAQLKPTSAEPHVGRAMVYLRMNELKKAIDECTTALQLEPDSVYAYADRMAAYSRLGKGDLALHDLEAARKINTPDASVLLNAEAWFRATCPNDSMRNGPAAVATAQKACQLSKNRRWSYLGTLAAAYAEIGDFNKAIATEHQALSLATAPLDRKRIEKHLKLFEQRKPVRAGPDE